ncbi:Histidine triad nucleotide-binding protein isoform 2 [Schistosoma japonicum]|uniref:Adenosine 5'-monophosphoramidase HINT3 n=1 Tax=Schistosoma japonicum TaxID=6182 RepID=A0A4Z2D1R1_SCHJA|nr:Histidine triad nucleotide-binding protein 3 [Schistosoma japonicum]KAH8860136.1 Histidine triad nucleotide-binding protein 3 [Schistosoma japonicum]TNN10413.1 Histidine triad nucleotide-binding protein isoform 2 [Schistosoma japonicum]TNN10414.1 Histidine triad nucleotide-binding protein isoform 2 [Schistosoma japonicum]
MLSSKEDCVFCSIVNGKANQPIRLETNNLVIFDDHLPKAQYHFQCVPKRHIKNAKHLTYEDIPLVVDMINYGRSFVNQLQLNPEDFLFGFHWPPFNSVHHLHMHILGPKQHMSFNPMFDSRFYIFREAKKLLDSLQNANVKERSNVNQV